LEVDSVQLVRYLAILNRRKWVVAFTTAACLAVVVLGCYLATPTYTASATLRVRGNDADYGNLYFMDRLMRTYVELLASKPFMAEAIDRLQLHGDAAELARAVEAEVLGSTELIQVRVDRTNPTEASKIANTLADLLVEQEAIQNHVDVIEPAEVPRIPTRPALTKYLILGAILGLLGGLCLALVFENLDKTLYSPQEVQAAAGLPVLGGIPGFRRVTGAPRAPLLLDNHAEQGAALEAFSALSVGVLCRAKAEGLRSLLVTSAEGRAGRSTVAANLAAGIATSGCRVILVDADVYNPIQHALFEIQKEPGLTEALAHPGGEPLPLQNTAIPGLQVLAAGAGMDAPPSVLSMSGTAALQQALAGQADLVIWDSGALLASAEAAALAHQVEGVVLVAAVGQATEEHLKGALQRLAVVGSPVLGIVINRVHTGGDRGAGRERAPDWQGESVEGLGDDQVGLSAAQTRPGEVFGLWEGRITLAEPLLPMAWRRVRTGATDRIVGSGLFWKLTAGEPVQRHVLAAECVQGRHFDALPLRFRCEVTP
jgi:polysaccharide biosynthesis transport protein